MKFQSIEAYYEWLRSPESRELHSRAGKRSYELHGSELLASANRFYESHPDERVRRGLVTQERHPEIAENLGKLPRALKAEWGRKGVRRAMKLHPNLQRDNGILTNMLHPTLSSETLKRTNERYPGLARRAHDEAVRLFPDMSKRGGLTSGRANAESGEIFMALAMVGGRKIAHGDHWHRSSPEVEFCQSLQKTYGPLLHPNIRFNRLELDWVVGVQGVEFNPKDLSTWSKVIEHHVVWRNGETAEGYNLRRGVPKLQCLGIDCEIEVVCIERGMTRVFLNHNL